MNKKLLLLLLSLLSLIMSGCNDDNDVKSIDLNLFAGTWEVVDQGNQQVFVRTCMLDITSAKIHENYGGDQGYITTYFLTESGALQHDRVFTWSIREVDSHQPLLNVVCHGELDSNDPWEGNYPYKIVKLTDSNMWWQVNTIGDQSTIKLHRCND